MFSLLRQTQLNLLREQSSKKSADSHATSRRNDKSERLHNDETLSQSNYLSNIRKDILSNTLPYSTSSSSSNATSNKYKQIARIICHIRDDIHAKYPQVIMPTRRMIECLVYNAFDNSIANANLNKDNEDWHELVIGTLKNIRDLTDAGLFETKSHCEFTETDGVTPLFPSFELFDEWDAHKFSQTLLFHLQKELN